MIGYENNPQPREEKDTSAALSARVRELEARPLTLEDFREAMHRLTTRGFELSLDAIGADVMKAIESEDPHDARMAVARIIGSMITSRYLDSLNKAQDEGY